MHKMCREMQKHVFVTVFRMDRDVLRATARDQTIDEHNRVSAKAMLAMQLVWTHRQSPACQKNVWSVSCPFMPGTCSQWSPSRQSRGGRGCCSGNGAISRWVVTPEHTGFLCERCASQNFSLARALKITASVTSKYFVKNLDDILALLDVSAEEALRHENDALRAEIAVLKETFNAARLGKLAELLEAGEVRLRKRRRVVSGSKAEADDSDSEMET